MHNFETDPRAIGQDLAGQAPLWWTEAARAAQIDLSSFDPATPLEQRVGWARAHGLKVGGILARQSTKMQNSIESQIRENVEYSARNRIYTPPEYCCADVQTGRKSNREGLNRMRQILGEKLIDILIVFKVSRLFRAAHKGFAFIQEEVVERGLRAISPSQGIDTDIKVSWKTLMMIHGLSDEMLLTATSDHVRLGLTDLFLQGYVTGGITVGYVGVEVPGARPTKLGRPRRMPAVAPDVDRLIVQAFDSVRNGMSLCRARRQWLAAGGPSDPRSGTTTMSATAFRRLLSNPRYIGRWAFCRKKNQWFSGKDSMRQIEVPEPEVRIVQSEELRIVSDELFFAVQKILQELKLGAHGPKRRENPQLWDFVTDLFYCPHCQVRYYQHGANGTGMTCKNQDLCPCTCTLRREPAVKGVCDKLCDLIQADTQLVTDIVLNAEAIDGKGDEQVWAEAEGLERGIKSISQKIEDLTDLAGNGSEEDRAALKIKVRMAQAERAGLRAQQAQVQGRLQRRSEPITPEQVQAILAGFVQLLEDGAAGNLGADMVQRATAVFRLLVGDRIYVHVEQRAGRKRGNVRGTFRPQILQAVRNHLGRSVTVSLNPLDEVSVWLRKPPKKDLLAARVHELVDVQGMSCPEVAELLRTEGGKFDGYGISLILRRWYEMARVPSPARPYNNGRPRKQRG